MIARTERITLGATATKLFDVPALALHNFLVRPSAACEISFAPFAWGQGLALDAKEPFAMNWRDFRHLTDQDWIGIWATDNAGAATIDVALVVR